MLGVEKRAPVGAPLPEGHPRCQLHYPTRVLLPRLGGVIYRLGGFAGSGMGCVRDVSVVVQLRLGVSTDALA